MPSRPAEMEVLLTLAKNFWKTEIKLSRSALFHMKTRVSVKYFVNDCLWKPLFDSYSLQTPSDLISLTVFVDSKAFDTVLT